MIVMACGSEYDVNDSKYLRSRIDQQSELICILKRRADEYLEKYMTQEETVKSLKETNESLLKETKQEKEKCEYVQKKLEKTISEKDCHMEDARCLQSQYEQSVKQISGLESQLQCISHALKQKELLVQELKESSDDASISSSVRKNKDKEILVKCKREIPAMRQTITELKKFVKDNLVVFENEFSQIRDGMKKLSIEQNAIVNQVTLKDKELADVSNTLSELTNENISTKTRVQSLEKKLSSANDSLNKQKVVQNLKDRVGELEDELSSYVVQFDAYKSHATDLLKKEREMNAQLRRMKKRGSVVGDQ